MLTVKYLREVFSPPDRKGQVDQVRDLPDRIARRLQTERYVMIVQPPPVDSLPPINNRNVTERNESRDNPPPTGSVKKYNRRKHNAKT